PSLSNPPDVAVAQSNYRRIDSCFLPERGSRPHSSFTPMIQPNKNMKIKYIATIVAIGLLPISGFAQTTPAPPEPPAPPRPPGPPGVPGHHHEKGPKVPVTYLGIETSQVPDVVSEQLGLAKGLGLVVEYVEPNSPAASAGIQQNDILKM